MRRFFKGVGIVIGSVVALVLVTAAIAAAVFHVHVGNGIGDREYTVASASELDRPYQLGIGRCSSTSRSFRFPRARRAR